jgi:hypothetical protein
MLLCNPAAAYAFLQAAPHSLSCSLCVFKKEKKTKKDPARV